MKFVYEDGKTKVIKGYILEEDSFTIKVEQTCGRTLILGKRSIFKISPIEKDGSQ